MVSKSCRRRRSIKQAMKGNGTKREPVLDENYTSGSLASSDDRTTTSIENVKPPSGSLREEQSLRGPPDAFIPGEGTGVKNTNSQDEDRCHSTSARKKGKKRRREDVQPHSGTEIVKPTPSFRQSNDRRSPVMDSTLKVVTVTQDERGLSSAGSRVHRQDVDTKPGYGSARPSPGPSQLSELQQRMRHKLEGAQFRMINESLYTSESTDALKKFQQEPDLFDVYHRGFREQVEKWPVHPLDVIIRWLGKYPKARVADFGCGEARLAATVPNKVYSFDLVSRNPRVTACDMASVPLKDSSVHVVVFCLSLMGTNLADFLREAHRVLAPGGLMKVAEVRSRFEGEEGGVERFLDMVQRLGFDRRQLDRSNKMFLMAEFKKSGRRPEDGVEFEAKACVYKRR